MTSKDYYFDSYAHFGIHEVIFFNAKVYTCNSNLKKKMFFSTFLFCQLWTFSGDAKRWSPHSHLPQFHVSQQAFVQGQSGSGCGQWHRHPLHVCCQSGSQKSNRGKLRSILYRFTSNKCFYQKGAYLRYKFKYFFFLFLLTDWVQQHFRLCCENCESQQAGRWCVH